MAIHEMSNESQADYAILNYLGWNRETHGPLYMAISHAGCVLRNDGEYNGYDDSDFYATVWNRETQRPERVTFATTRGWTYPNHADVDATPEVLAEYEAYCAREQAKHEAACEAKRAAERAAKEHEAALKVQAVELAKQRRRTARLGKYTGEFAWCAVARNGKSIRVGVKTPDGQMHWGSAAKLEIL
jgi:hypothetical protein